MGSVPQRLVFVRAQTRCRRGIGGCGGSGLSGPVGSGVVREGRGSGGVFATSGKDGGAVPNVSVEREGERGAQDFGVSRVVEEAAVCGGGGDRRRWASGYDCFDGVSARIRRRDETIRHGWTRWKSSALGSDVGKRSGGTGDEWKSPRRNYHGSRQFRFGYSSNHFDSMDYGWRRGCDFCGWSRWQSVRGSCKGGSVRGCTEQENCGV
mmetsp:Transcript_11342/g.23896  ORF Transcript_11342/g.23896 Transcript_11342/m.23896 type:complete len:208 (+) Transcript_11342:1239-1862(+)